MRALFALRNRLSPTQARLGGFIAISLALHLLTVMGTGRLDLSARRFGDAPARVDLHATLAPAAPAQAGPESPLTRDEAGTATQSAQEPVAIESPPRPGAATDAGGLGAPAADRWYTAREVDVRAEPLTDIRLRYPENLRGQAVFGTVRLRLFIDERGVVRKMQVAGSEPEGMFDEAAKQVWQDVMFSPALKNGAPVKSQKLLELTYQPGLM